MCYVCKFLYVKSYDLNTDLYLDYFLNALLAIQLGAWFDALKEPPPPDDWVKTESNRKSDLLADRNWLRKKEPPPTQP